LYAQASFPQHPQHQTRKQPKYPTFKTRTPTFGAEAALVELLEVEAAVVEALVVVLGVHVPPHLVHVLPAARPLLLLLAQPLVQHRERLGRVAPQQVQHVQAVVAVDALHAPQVDGWIERREWM
jgi:hypothetical protein